MKTKSKSLVANLYNPHEQSKDQLLKASCQAGSVSETLSGHQSVRYVKTPTALSDRRTTRDGENNVAAQAQLRD